MTNTEKLLVIAQIANVAATLDGLPEDTKDMAELIIEVINNTHNQPLEVWLTAVQEAKL
jgi:hypothetical protein